MTVSGPPPRQAGRHILVQGIVQGVGFRPQALRLARQLGITGSVRNEGTSALIQAFGPPAALRDFEASLAGMRCGGLRIDALLAHDIPAPEPLPTGFEIEASTSGQASLGISPDLATCPACVAEATAPHSRRYRYPLNACAECGPRLSVFQRAPYDRAHTTMAPFPLCADCEREYADSDDRRFHAQAMACHTCGPKVVLRRLDGTPLAVNTPDALDDIDAAAQLIAQGEILLIKGIGGYQLACDATHAEAVARLRTLKQREAKPFALLMRDLAMLRRWCEVDAASEAALLGTAAPIALLPRRACPDPGCPPLAEGIAPGLSLLGAMLPPSALHHLLMLHRRAPIVLTSGNLSGEPQAITLAQAAAHAGAQVAHVLDHQRAVERRVDDSVGRSIAGAFRVMRRARGYAPAPLALPPGFDAHTRVLALGGDLKNTFALLHGGQGVLSQHMGDLHDATCLTDQQQALADYLRFYDFQPELIACDKHPGYAATQLAEDQFTAPRTTVGHHHAHIAACLGEHGWPLDGGRVLGIALDGLGLGDGGQLWGGEFLLADYQTSQRVGSFKPVPLLGGDQAAREPWRNTYAQLMTAMTWDEFAAQHGGLALAQYLQAKPRALLDQLMAKPRLAPPASSVGRLFDAVAAAIGICPDRAAYEGEAAMRMEGLITHGDLADLAGGRSQGYPFAITASGAPVTPNAQDAHNGINGLSLIDPSPMWPALLADLHTETPPTRMSARFHHGLADAVVRQAAQLASVYGIRTVALGGGVFQNRALTEQVLWGLAQAGLLTLLPTQVPCNDGGLAWGQALIALARHQAAR